MFYIQIYSSCCHGVKATNRAWFLLVPLKNMAFLLPRRYNNIWNMDCVCYIKNNVPPAAMMVLQQLKHGLFLPVLSVLQERSSSSCNGVLQQ